MRSSSSKFCDGRTCLCLAVWLCFSVAPLHAQSGYSYYLTGNGGDAQVGGSLGGVVLAGGGSDVDSAMTWFKNRANGGDIVILRASGSDGYNDYLFSDLVNGGTPETGQLIVPTIAIPQGNWFGYAIDRNSLGPASTIFFDNYSVSFTPADPGLTGDLNGDGFVGINDLNEVLGNWNAGTPPAAAEVPEPTALTLLGTGAVLGLTRRKR